MISINLREQSHTFGHQSSAVGVDQQLAGRGNRIGHVEEHSQADAADCQEVPNADANHHGGGDEVGQGDDGIAVSKGLRQVYDGVMSDYDGPQLLFQVERLLRVDG